MKTLFWTLGLCAVAVALALLMGYNMGTVTLFWPPHRLDMSVNLVLVLTLVLFGLMHASLRAIAALRQLPGQARRWRQQQLERTVVASLLDAVVQLLAGRYARAQHQARQALDHLGSQACRDWSQRQAWSALCHLLLAEAAHGLRETERRNTHLDALTGMTRATDVVREGAFMRAMRWSMEDRDLESAQRWWNALPQGAARRIHALRLKLRLSRLDGKPAEALDTARLLAKHGAFSPRVARSLIRSLAQESVLSASDLSQLQAVWQAWAPSERDMPELVLAVSSRAVDFATEQGSIQAWQWLLPLWPQFASLDVAEQEQLVLTAEAALPHLDGAGLALIEQNQRQYPDSSYLLYLAGQACMQRGLWGKASQFLTLAKPGLHGALLKRRCWIALARLAQERGDTQAALQAWQQAATVV